MVRDARRQYVDEALHGQEAKAAAQRHRRAIAAGKAPEPDVIPRVVDWRTPAERDADQARTGTWWRCRTHGPTQDPTLVGPVPYCSAPDCTEHLLLARSSSRDGIGDWTRPREVVGIESFRPHAPRPRSSKSRAERPTTACPAVDSEVVQAAAAACAPAETVSPPDPPPAPPVPEPTEVRPMAAHRDNAQIVFDILEAAHGAPANRPFLLTHFAMARPDLGDRAGRNLDATLQRLRRAGRLSHGIDGWTVTDAPAPVAKPKGPKPRKTARKPARAAAAPPQAPASAPVADAPVTGANARDAVRLPQELATRLDALVDLGLWPTRDDAVAQLLGRALDRIATAFGSAA